MDIRRAVTADAPALARQVEQVAAEGRWLAVEADHPREDISERFRVDIEDGQVVLALEHQGRIVGNLVLRSTQITGVHSLVMSLLAEVRGQGWGRRLLAAALDAAPAIGARKVTLEVFPENGRAIGLYASAGFHVEGYLRDHYPRSDGSLRSSVLMAWFAPAPG